MLSEQPKARQLSDWAEMDLIATDQPCSRCGYNLRGVPRQGPCPECGMPLMVEGGMVSDECPCLQCGYSLKGLATNGVCPECGSEIARSLQGNLLVYSSIQFVNNLSVGATCVLAGLILFCIWIGCQFLPGAVFGRDQVTRIALGVLSIASSALSLGGWWLLSTPDPALMGQDRATGSRRVLRAALIVSISAFLIGLMAQRVLDGSYFGSGSSSLAAVGSWLLWGATLASLLNWPIKTIASLMYVRSLAERIPSAELAVRAKRLVQFAIGGAGAIAIVVLGAVVMKSANGSVQGWELFAFLPFCGIFVGILVWSAVYASLVGGLRKQILSVSRTQAVCQPPRVPATRE